MYLILNNKNMDNNKDNINGSNKSTIKDNNNITSKKILVDYYSAQSHTEAVAKKLQLI